MSLIDLPAKNKFTCTNCQAVTTNDGRTVWVCEQCQTENQPVAAPPASPVPDAADAQAAISDAVAAAGAAIPDIPVQSAAPAAFASKPMANVQVEPAAPVMTETPVAPPPPPVAEVPLVADQPLVAEPPLAAVQPLTASEPLAQVNPDPVSQLGVVPPTQ